MIPVTAIVITKNEEANIRRCLESLKDFSEVIAVDSNSIDDTCALAAAAGAKVVPFTWNGRYPKKKQWCLEHLDLKHDRVFFVDADEVVTEELVRELETLFSSGPVCDGYFVKGLYVIDGKVMRHGVHNNKLCLFDQRKMAFPVIDDLDLPGMGEVEGHYQPVFKDGAHGSIGQLKAPLYHYAYEENWEQRHKRYAAWERGMNARGAWPEDPVRGRQVLKRLFRALPGRGVIAFLHCYVYKLGVLDGKPGLLLAKDRFRYYQMIAKAPD